MQQIKLENKNNTIKVVNRKDGSPIRIVNRINNVRIKQSGKTGPAGAAGVGLPAGGLPGQTIVKTGIENYATEWATPDGSDKYFIKNFSLASMVEVDHNLSKYPSVTVHDSSGAEVEGDINHTSINSLIISFSAQFSGVVTCN